MAYVRFEWDERKNSLNKRKHGISFEEASTCFEDDFAEVFHDGGHSDGEDRSILIGMSLILNTVVVVFTERVKGNGKEVANRIISARKATKNEFQYYWTRRKGLIQ